MAMIRTYTETYDLNTEEGCPTLLGIHTPIGTIPYRFLSPAFKMYRKYKYLGCDVTIVNSARLPVDPEQVGKIAGTNYVDPRDILNPILFKGCHGESLGAVLDSMYNGLLSNVADFHTDSLDKEVFKTELTNFYYTALGDDSWRKSAVQKTLNIKGLHPMIYSLATQHQIMPTNGLSQENYRENNPATPSSPAGLGDTVGSENGQFSAPSASGGWVAPLTGPTQMYNPNDGTYSYKYGLQSMFTSRMQRLGWMDTLQMIGQNYTHSTPAGTEVDNIALLPKIFMGILMLPPANLVRQYLRVIIRHKFKFAQFRTITTGAVDGSFWNPETQPWGYWEVYSGNESSGSKELSDADLESEVVEDEKVDG